MLVGWRCWIRGGLTMVEQWWYHNDGGCWWMVVNQICSRVFWQTFGVRVLTDVVHIIDRVGFDIVRCCVLTAVINVRPHRYAFACAYALVCLVRASTRVWHENGASASSRVVGVPSARCIVAIPFRLVFTFGGPLSPHTIRILVVNDFT